MNQDDEGDEDPEIDSDDLMLYIDQALLKIVTALPESNKKACLNKKLLGLTRATFDQAMNEKILVIQPQTFIQFLV